MQVSDHEISLKKSAFISALAILLLTFFGPFGTFSDLSYFSRLLFWFIAVVGCGSLFKLTFFILAKFSWFNELSKNFRYLLAVFCTSFPAIVLIYYNNLFMRGIAFEVKYLPWIWLTILVIGSTIISIKFLVQFGNTRIKAKIHQEELAKIDIKADKNILKFLDKLPDNLGSQLVSLSMHDHYIEVTTKQDKAMVHMRFSEAMELLKNYPGFQIHRSHWVSTSAIKGVHKEGRKNSVKLINGKTLPVSEKYKSVLQQRT